MFAQKEQAIAQYKQGEKYLLKEDFEQAAKHFRKAIKIESGFTAAWNGLGVSCENSGDVEGAIEAFEHLLSQDSMYSRNLYFRLGTQYHKHKDSQLALEYYRKFEAYQALEAERFSIVTPETMEEELGLLQQLPSRIKACEISIDSVKFVNITEVIPLNANINTEADEYFPFLSNDQRVLYFNRIKNNDEDLFYSIYRNEEWWPPAPLRRFNTKNNEGMCTLVKDGKKMFFTACGRQAVEGTCDIWEAELHGLEIEAIQPITGFANSSNWESEASISCDGRTLIFASNRAGGYGGTDLWKSTKTGDGIWSAPQNLGPKINTYEDEESPFLSNDGRSIYFTSKGHVGLGEQDIFVSWLDEANDEWGVPINIGPPVNSPFRELGFFLSADGQTGYFASDRPGGQGGMDIYTFKLNETLLGLPITYVEGFVRDSITSQAVEAVLDIEGQGEVKTDADGRFFLCLPAESWLSLSINKKGYLPYAAKSYIPEWDNKQFFSMEILLQNIDAILGLSDESENEVVSKINRPTQVFRHPVYFGFDDHKISPKELNALVDFMENIDVENIKQIEIIGFSDNVGSDIYNLKLSERRAKEIALYLVNLELSIDQIYIEGKGKVEDDGAPQEYKRRVDLKITVYKK